MTKLNTLALLLSLTACAAEEASEGLQLEISEQSRIAGTYSHDGVSLAFDFSRDDHRQTLAFHAADGRPLITTTLEGAYQTTTVFDGELVASGITNAPDPTLLGDRTAMERLQALPEAGLLEGLRDALVTAGADETLYNPQPPPVESVYNWDGRYFLFADVDYRSWLSAAGASPTYVYVQNPWQTESCGVVEVESPGRTMRFAVEPGGSTYRTGYWWGAIITVWNTGGLYVDGRYCKWSWKLIRVSPYTWSP